VWQISIADKPHLYQPGWGVEGVLVDVGEMEIERPKKNKMSTLASRNVTRSSRNC